MKRKYILIILVAVAVILILTKLGYDFYLDHQSSGIIANVIARKHYSVTQADQSIELDLFIKPEWIPFDSNTPKELNVLLKETHNTKIILREVWNRGDDIYFSFTTRYNLNFKKGEFLYNMILNESGTTTSNGTYHQIKLFDLNQVSVDHRGVGFGPNSDFSFGIDPDQQLRIKNGFYVRYTGMFLYGYSRE